MSARITLRINLFTISLAAVLWGTTGIVVHLLHRDSDLSPVSIGFYRLATAAAVLLAIRHPRPLLVALRSAPVSLVLAGVGLGAYQALYFVAVTLGGVSLATVISLGLAPVLLVGWETATARQLPSRITVFTVSTGVIGLLLICLSTTRPTDSAPRPLLGLIVAASCGACYAASTVVSRQLIQQMDAMTLATLASGIGAVVLMPLALLGGAAALAVPLAGEALLGLAYLGAVTTALAYGLFYTGLRGTAGSTAAVLTLLEPVAAAALAALVLRERLPLPAGVGGLLLLGSIAVLYLRPDRPAGAAGNGEPHPESVGG